MLYPIYILLHLAIYIFSKLSLLPECGFLPGVMVGLSIIVFVSRAKKVKSSFTYEINIEMIHNA